LSSYYLIAPGNGSKVLNHLLDGFIAGAGEPVGIIRNKKDLPSLVKQRIAFAVQLDHLGQCPEMNSILSLLHTRGENALLGSSAVVFTVSPNELFTKSYTQHLIFLLNRLGCSFPGHPLIEAVEGLRNFRTWQKTLDLSLREIAWELSKRLGDRFMQDRRPQFENPRVLALHAGSRKTSNTVMLWDMIKAHLSGWDMEELNVDKGMVMDCRGCDFRECRHFSQQDSCFYGGVVVKEILPAVERADVIVWICPNYNDAISANLMAVINRMTALYRKISFYQKTFFAVIVSGNSGSDSVAKQLIGALNVNKGFRLPAKFSLMAIANDPGDIRNIPDIPEQARLFALHMMGEMRGDHFKIT